MRMHGAGTVPRRERGVALITALLVVALATTAAVAMVVRQQLEIRRSANMLASDQALLYDEGARDWAGELLRRDYKKGQTDSLDEDWAQKLPPISVQGGLIAGEMEDLQGRFNLNNLVQHGKVSQLDLKRFRRLLSALGLSMDLANAVLDWMDPDNEVRFPGGAEYDTYSRRSPPYRAANHSFVDPSELRLVAGFDDKAWAAIAPYVTALPKATSINVNTAPAPVLQSLAEGVTAEDAKQLVANRPDHGYGSVSDFLAQDSLAGRDIRTNGLSVSSHYFLLRSRIKVGDMQARFYTVLKRDKSGTGIPLRWGRGDYGS